MSESADAEDVKEAYAAGEMTDEEMEREIQQRMAEEEDPDGGYGLPMPRDPKTDQPLPQDHEYEWGGREVTIELIPPTLDQLEEYQGLGEDVDMDRLREIIDDHITKPERDAGSMTVRELNCYIEGIIDYGQSGGDDKLQKVREELQKRNGRGNAT